MSSQNVPIHRTNADASSSKKDETWFNAFDFAPGQDSNIRWLSRPNSQLTQGKYSPDTEKFRITFDVENFKAEQIKIYIQNRRLTISGVYEERSEGRFTQKQFERTFDIPATADVDAMASFITPNHTLVVEIPLNASAPVDHLSINNNANNQRRQSFSLNKFDTTNQQGLSATSNDLPNLSAPGQSVRRTSITKTTTTTTSGSSGLPAEAANLVRSADSTTGNTSQTYSTTTTERQSANTGNQPNSSSTTSNKQTLLTASDLANLPIEIPPELLASGGTITIQKRRVSVSKGVDGTNEQGASVPSTQSTNNESKTSSTTTTTSQNTQQTGSVPIARNDNNSSTTTTTTAQSSNQTGNVPIARSNDTQSALNTSNQQQSSTSERRGSQSTSSNQSRAYTLEEFLQNKTWNPSLVDGANGKKILQMRLQMKPGTKSDQMKISLNGYDLRVEVDNKASTEGGRQMSEHSYRQVTLFPTCDVNQLKTELKDDGYLQIQVPITL